MTNAERITKGSNLRWLITVRPDGDGQVAITLPVTEDCDAEGAICTGDGRRLSNRLELTVGGPGAVGPSPEDGCRTTIKPAHMNQAGEARSEAMNPAPHPRQRLQTQRRNNHSVTGISRQALNRD